MTGDTGLRLSSPFHGLRFTQLYVGKDSTYIRSASPCANLTIGYDVYSDIARVADEAATHYS